ncbi:DNA polymerase V [Pseudomonas syringae]|uniref:LexA family protein n=1 Tax=Pseudomonas syringae TaxID=317 RepID=UPI00089C4414|nr:translesion error-prone DNA polymerase V autoproteolytic subunit [Pseudomonas syringae]SDW49965.1 DNA polymerase V [Pseudomonas syringae]SFL75838.1 DNA polymerase V [Pseudomonas syringae]
MSVTVLGAVLAQGVPIPFFSATASAGFPSPATDHIEKHISLDELFNIRAPHVYLVRVDGDSMQKAGIFSGDLVIVDRSREAVHGDIVVASLNSEPICKRFHLQGRQVCLVSENDRYSPMELSDEDELVIWGVVQYSVRDHGRG